MELKFWYGLPVSTFRIQNNTPSKLLINRTRRQSCKLFIPCVLFVLGNEYSPTLMPLDASVLGDMFVQIMIMVCDCSWLWITRILFVQASFVFALASAVVDWDQLEDIGGNCNIHTFRANCDLRLLPLLIYLLPELENYSSKNKKRALVMELVNKNSRDLRVTFLKLYENVHSYWMLL